MQQFDLQKLDSYVLRSKFTVEKHSEANIFIYGYNWLKPGSQIVWDSINIHLRGIILNNDGNVVARPFAKFFTYYQYIGKNTCLTVEGQKIELPDCSFRLFEKVDGSMVTLYWLNDKPYMASINSFVSEEAQKATEILYQKYAHLFSSLDRSLTYVFELICDYSRVMVDYYGRKDLILIAVIDNQTAQSVSIEKWGFPIPMEYTSDYGHISNLEELKTLNLPNLEGFILEYENGFRIKLKFPWWSEAYNHYIKIQLLTRDIYHHKKRLSKLLGFKAAKLSNLELWQMLRNKQPIPSVLMNIPEEYYTWGFEPWFNNTIYELQQKRNDMLNIHPHLSEDESWDMVKPERLEYFSVEQRRLNPEHATILWGLINRVANNYL
jgi:RNA ligase